jgi:hypothetical protein
MDDNAIARRPLNKRASKLLHRPNTYGPILVNKTTFRESDSQLGRSEDIICFERIDEKELLSQDFKDLRVEWVKAKGAGDAPMVIQIG